jgi:hypothetical protein
VHVCWVCGGAGWWTAWGSCMRASLLSCGLHCRLVDRMGGIDAAVALVKEAADIPADEQVTLREVSRDLPSLQAALAAGGATTSRDALRMLLTDPTFVISTLGFAVVPLVLNLLALAAAPQTTPALQLNGSPQLSLDSLFQPLADGSAGGALRSALFPQAVMPDVRLGGALGSSEPQSALDALDQLR